MRNIKLIIEYDGTDYSGWQLQPNGLSIQQVMEEALAKMLGEQVRIHSSGRTDAGVHARGMVATFKTEKPLPLRAFSDGLNSLLPPDIAVRDALEVPIDFHPRFDAKRKHYRYNIYNGRRRSPLGRLYAWHIRGVLDLAAMEKASSHFLGEKDYSSFRAANCCSTSTIRRIDQVEIFREGEIITIDVIGSGFLKNMVRIMVGTLVEVGQGKMASEEVGLLFSNPSREAAGITAPSHGLCLMEVFYDEIGQ